MYIQIVISYITNCTHLTNFLINEGWLCSFYICFLLTSSHAKGYEKIALFVLRHYILTSTLQLLKNHCDFNHKSHTHDNFASIMIRQLQCFCLFVFSEIFSAWLDSFMTTFLACQKSFRMAHHLGLYLPQVARVIQLKLTEIFKVRSDFLNYYDLQVMDS